MPPKTGVKVKLDRQRTLRLTMRGIMALEDETGLTLTEVGERVRAGSFRTIVAIVWAALLHEDPELTIEAAADLMDKGDLTEIAEAAGRAMQEQFGGEDEPEGNRKAASAKKKS